MSSGFVTAGTAVPKTPATEEPKLDAWSAAQAAVEASQKPSAEGLEPQDERSLYDILQANKAKKQEEFEEKLKFKNQFKTLDEDDVDYLDSILKTEKAVADARREELESKLDDFRRQQTEVDRSGGGEAGEQDTAVWVAGKKRRRKEVPGNVLGVKVRRKSSSVKKADEDGKKADGDGKKADEDGAQDQLEKQPAGAGEKEKVAAVASLVAYGSDDD